MDANEWMSAFKQGLEMPMISKVRTSQPICLRYSLTNVCSMPTGSPKYNTDWQDEAISIQRTGEGSSIGAFINYTDQQGILLNSYFKRINAKLAYDDKPTDWLSTSVNLLVKSILGVTELLITPTDKVHCVQ